MTHKSFDSAVQCARHTKIILKDCFHFQPNELGNMFFIGCPFDLPEVEVETVVVFVNNTVRQYLGHKWAGVYLLLGG